MVISAAATYVIAIILKATIGLRVTDEVEINGVDLAVHGETAYETLGARRTGTDLTGRGDTAYETTGSTARVTTEAK